MAEKRYIDEEVQSRRYPGMTYTKTHVEVLCCGEWMRCSNFTNTCEHCHKDFNFAGQALAPRSQWGEETGEHWSDCI